MILFRHSRGFREAERLSPAETYTLVRVLHDASAPVYTGEVYSRIIVVIQIQVREIIC